MALLVLGFFALGGDQPIPRAEAASLIPRPLRHWALYGVSRTGEIKKHALLRTLTRFSLGLRPDINDPPFEHAFRWGAGQLTHWTENHHIYDHLPAELSPTSEQWTFLWRQVAQDKQESHVRIARLVGDLKGIEGAVGRSVRSTYFKKPVKYRVDDPTAPPRQEYWKTIAGIEVAFMVEPQSVLKARHPDLSVHRLYHQHPANDFLALGHATRASRLLSVCQLLHRGVPSIYYNEREFVLADLDQFTRVSLPPSDLERHYMQVFEQLAR